MSKKNLSRTIIEGGRRDYNKFDRYMSNREQRTAERIYLKNALIDEDYADSKSINKRRHVFKEFNDKLGPMYRWLRDHVGQRWDEVQSKAKSICDTRTIAGRHILYDHMFPSVCVNQVKERWRKYDFYVDEEGILRLSEKSRWNRKRRRSEDEQYIRVSGAELVRWARNRRVIDYGNVQFWTREPTRFSWRKCTHRRYRIECPYPSRQVEADQLVNSFYTSAPAKSLDELASWQRHGAFKKGGFVYKRVKEWHCYGATDESLAQGDRFTKEEAEFWRKLHPRDREALLQTPRDSNRKR